MGKQRTELTVPPTNWSPYLNGHIHSLRWQVLVVALSMYKVGHGHGVESVLHRTSEDQTGYAHMHIEAQARNCMGVASLYMCILNTVYLYLAE